MAAASENLVGDEGSAASGRQVSLSSEGDVLRIMPSGFLLAYQQLWSRAYEGGSVKRDPDAQVASVPSGAKVRLSSGATDARGAARSGGKRAGVSGRAVVRDERAQAMRAGVDRKLRKLAREMSQFLHGAAKAGVRRCTGRKCRQWAEDGWNFCPRCGHATEEV